MRSLPVPYRNRFRSSSGISSHGTDVSTPNVLATLSKTCSSQPNESWPYGSSAPWSMLTDPSGTTRSGSISCVNPRPWQAGQAPCGLLKLKMRGSISGSEMPQWTQANFSLKVSLPPSSASSTSTRPSARAAAVSTESVSRRLSPSFITSRSTMTAMSCLNFLSRSMSSSSSRTSPSTSTRVNPSARSCSNSLPYSPLRPRTTGATTLKRVPGSSSQMWSTICCTLCPEMGRPQVGQCGWPTRA